MTQPYYDPRNIVAAARALFEALDELVGSVDRGDEPDIVAWDKARAALAQAKGEKE